MDERQLRTLFDDAAGEPPPPSFSTEDIVAASARARARHRMRVATGTTVAAVVLASGGLFAAFGPLTSDEEHAAGQADNPTTQLEQPEAGAERHEGGDTGEDGSSEQGDGQSDRQGPGATSTDECDSVDRELANALAGELPADAYQDNPVPGPLPCPPGVRSAGFVVEDGSAAGIVSVTISPATVATPDADEPGTEAPDGPAGDVASAQARTSAGATVTVVSTARDAEPPFAGDLQRIADAVAAQQ